MKKTLSLFLTLVMLLSTFSGLAFTASAADSYKLFYELNSDGTGYMVTGCQPVAGKENNVKIPEKYKGKNVIGIEDGAFHWMDWVVSIHIPSTVKIIKTTAFDSCGSLKKFTVDNNNKYFCASKGVLFNKKKTKLVAFPCRHSATSYTVPSSVKSISEFAFAASSLEKLKISKNVTTIDEYTFSLSNIKSITLPSNLNKIAGWAFYMCYNLSEIVLPLKVKNIGDYAFYGCGFKEVTIPKSVTKIGNEAFGFTVSDSSPDGSDKVSGFKIYGVAGSVAEQYANANNLSFVKVSVPKKPTLKTISNTSSGVKITWGKISGADKYRVYRKAENSSWKYLGSTSKTYYTDEDAKSGTKYYYAIKGRNEIGDSSLSGSLSKLYLADPTLKTPKSTKSGIVLKWNKITGAEGYMVYRKTGSGSYSKIATVKGNSKVTYTDKKASKGKTYTYKVKAYKSKTYSAYSNAKKIKDNY